MESLSSSVDYCTGGNHEHYSENTEEAEPSVKEMWSRFTTIMEQVRMLRSRNGRLSEELLDLKQRLGRETQEAHQLFDRELSRIRGELAAAAAQSEAEARNQATEEQGAELRTRHNDLEEQVKRLHQSFDTAVEELGEKTKALLVVRRRAELLDRERASERETRLQLNEKNDLLRAEVASQAARLQQKEREKQLLHEELQLQRQLHEQERRAMQHLTRNHSTNFLWERWQEEQREALEEERRQADKRMEAMETALRVKYEEKFQEMLHSSNNNEADQLRQQNKKLTQSLVLQMEKIADIKAENEKLNIQRSERAAAMEFERGRVSASWSQRDLQAASDQACRRAEAAHSAMMKADLNRQMDAVRAMMAEEKLDSNPSSIPRRNTKHQRAPDRAQVEDQPTSDNSDHLKWTSNPAYDTSKESEKPSVSKSNHPHLGARPASVQQQPKLS